ncbi:hypothetical protein D3C79_594020 [compost metagenome]
MIDIKPETLGGAFQISSVDEQRIGWQIAEQGRQWLAEEQRLPVFDTGRPGAFTHLLINMFGVATYFKLFTPLAAEQLNGGLIGRELVRWQQVDGFHFAQRALVIYIKGAQAVDLVVEKVDAIRLFAAHGIQIQQRTARSKFAMFHHLIDTAVSRLFQLCPQQIPR